MHKLTPEIFSAFQNKLKTGNRRGVHLNAIPGNSRYKLDLAQLAAIHQSLPEYFIVDLLTTKNVSFKFSVHDQFIEEIPEKKRDYFNENEEDEEDAKLGMVQKNATNEKEDQSKEKLKRNLENLIFQNEVIFSEKGVNSLGFGFPLLVRKDLSDGQITVAPLLIWSVAIKATNEMNTWEICRTEEDPIYINDVLINHLQGDSGITLEQIPEQMLADGKIDKPELFDICDSILRQLKVTQNLDFILNNYERIPKIQSKIEYDALLPKKGDATITKSGIFSIFEVQKQNIINDYEALKSNFKALEIAAKLPFQSITSVETDPSQQNILESLKSQNRILIQGPPGTGKSQTLTAVLVNALENKQKTIVVCEKQTALEVLYIALQKLGYERYCTMVKDSATDRKLVVNAVRNTIDSADFKKAIAINSLETLNNHILEISKHQESINTVHQLLNTDIIPDKNRTEIVGHILNYEAEKEVLGLESFNFTFSADEFKEIEHLIQVGAPIYKEYQPYISKSFINNGLFIKENYHQSLQRLDTSFENYRRIWNEIQRLIVEYKPVFIENRRNEFGQNLQNVELLINETEVLTSTLIHNSEEYLPEVTNQFFYKIAAFFSGAKKKSIQKQKRLVEISSAVKEISLKPLLPNIAISDNLFNNKNEILKYRSEVELAKNQFFTTIEENYNSIDFLNTFDKNNSDKDFTEISNKIQQLRNLINKENWLKENKFGSTYSEIKIQIETVLENFKNLRNNPENPLLLEYNWFSYYQNLSRFQQNLLEKLYPLNNWEASFLGNYFPLLLNKWSSENLNFNENEYADIIKKLKFYGITQKSFIAQYWNLEQQNAVKNFEKLNKEVTVANLYNKRSSTNHSRLTLRQIAQKDSDLFTTFFPIILTTPDVCSNLFQDKNFYFDNVVFDEASQLKLEDNLPAVLKGKTVIIAGDEHQMPPSNYFSKVFEGSIEDEDDLEAENEVITYKNAMLNIESLLDFAMENNFEKNHLDFHYRSKHPYLIDFSNHAFYNARLKPLPTQSTMKPIEFFQVNGIFEDHINELETQKVIEILKSIHPKKDGTYPSVGIATFNITQRNYIKRQILHQAALPENEAFREKIQGLEAAGLFIKNLENIQGDERDIIIISTTYGKKRSGKFVQSFGPVNHTKGYKLLNVIITRAKEKIYICNSIPEDFFMNYKTALEEEGANNRKAVFYAYLAYCKAVSDENEIQRKEILTILDVFGFTESAKSEYESTLFVDQIYFVLKERFPNLKILKNHQFGGYLLDLLIEKPDGKSVVVECMSKDQYSGNLAYLEDLHKGKILENSGFGYVRIWSQNCWQNLDAELQKIIRKIE